MSINYFSSMLLESCLILSRLVHHATDFSSRLWFGRPREKGQSVGPNSKCDQNRLVSHNLVGDYFYSLFPSSLKSLCGTEKLISTHK